MKKLFFPVVVVFVLFSCKKNEEYVNTYYSEFQLNESDGNTSEILITQKSPSTITGNSIRDSDSVAIGFEIRNSFLSPTHSGVTQQFNFSLSMLISEEEFNIDSGIYTLKNPSDFQNYVSSGNLFEEDRVSISTYFHEDTRTFCSAPQDSTFDNYFRITEKNYYTDDNGEDAMNLGGEFIVRYNLLCGDGDTKLIDGKFRVKLLIDGF